MLHFFNILSAAAAALLPNAGISASNISVQYALQITKGNAFEKTYTINQIMPKTKALKKQGDKCLPPKKI